MTRRVQIFTGLLFCAHVEIHIVRRLVYDNYQRCPVSSNVINLPSSSMCVLLVCSTILFWWTSSLTALDTFGNFQRPVFSLCISQHHMHTITNLGKFGSFGHWICKRIMKEKTPLLHYFECFQMHNKGPRLKSFIIQVRNYLSQKLRYFRGSNFSQCLILSAALDVAHYQVSFYANNYFE